MTVEELISGIGLDGVAEEKGDTFVITLRNSNEYARAYSLLDNSELVDLDPEFVSMSPTETTMLYLADEYDVFLRANLVDDVYRVEIKRARQ